MRRNEEESSKSSKVTLSGLLNFIDGIWSACGGERIIVFTTNYVEKLDPALIRRERKSGVIVGYGPVQKEKPQWAGPGKIREFQVMVVE